jgi:hypothetical protein
MRVRHARVVVGVAWAIASLSSRVLAGPALVADSTTTSTPLQEKPRWSSFLPLMKEEALARGYELPLPFGVSVIYNYLERDIDVTDIRIGVNGAPPRSVSQFLNLGSNSSVNAFLFRGDAWLLPFMNLYFLAGYIHNQSTSIGHVTVPRIGPGPPREFDIELPTELTGFVGGGGMTLAAGFREFFMMADANYSQTDIGFDDSFKAFIATARAGWNGRFGRVPTRVWAGGAYWDTENTASSTVDVAGVGRVQFEADQGPTHPWNATVGSQVSISKEWESFAEFGFNFEDVFVLITGATYRF